jgi:methionyl-tRNA formyltransferase
LRIIFAGTPEFARTALERLHASGHSIALVLTQPDRPAGRGMKLQASSVKAYALEHGMALAQPRSLRLDGTFPEDATLARATIAQAQAQVMVVAAYGLILPQWVLDTMAAAGYGCINIHGSLLPRWRGAAPIHRAIEAGDPDTGVTIMQMNAGLDTGDMLLTANIPIATDDTTASLHDRVADLGADLIVQALDRIAAGTLPALAQPLEGVTYAHKIEKHEAPLDWRLDAQTLERRVRAFNPFPTASLVCRGETIKVWRAKADLQLPPDIAPSSPGNVLSVSPLGIAVATGHGSLMLQELQRPGGKRLPAVEFLRGFDIAAGTRLDLTPDAA